MFFWSRKVSTKFGVYEFLVFQQIAARIQRTSNWIRGRRECHRQSQDKKGCLVMVSGGCVMNITSSTGWDNANQKGSNAFVYAPLFINQLNHAYVTQNILNIPEIKMVIKTAFDDKILHHSMVNQV